MLRIAEYVWSRNMAILKKISILQFFKIKNIYSKGSNTISVFTDGSYSPRHKKGSWAGVILTDERKETLTEIKDNTSQHEMELLGVIQCLGHIIAHYGNSCFIHIYTDSEYVTNLLGRRKKLESAQFLTKKGTPVAHAELIKQFYRILDRLSFKIERVSSHQKEGVSEISDLNREVDKLSRKILRKEIRNQ